MVIPKFVDSLDKILYQVSVEGGANKGCQKTPTGETNQCDR